MPIALSTLQWGLLGGVVVAWIAFGVTRAAVHRRRDLKAEEEIKRAGSRRNELDVALGEALRREDERHAAELRQQIAENDAIIAQPQWLGKTAPAIASFEQERLGKTIVTIRAQAADDGRLLGPVGVQDVAVALKQTCAIPIDQRRIHLDEPIRSTGSYMIPVELPSGAKAEVETIVTAA